MFTNIQIDHWNACMCVCAGNVSCPCTCVCVYVFIYVSTYVHACLYLYQKSKHGSCNVPQHTQKAGNTHVQSKTLKTNLLCTYLRNGISVTQSNGVESSCVLLLACTDGVEVDRDSLRERWWWVNDSSTWGSIKMVHDSIGGSIRMVHDSFNGILPSLFFFVIAKGCTWECECMCANERISTCVLTSVWTTYVDPNFELYVAHEQKSCLINHCRAHHKAVDEQLYMYHAHSPTHIQLNILYIYMYSVRKWIFEIM